MSRALFLELFGDVFEHTPQIAAGAYDAGLTTAQDTAEGLHAAMLEVLKKLPPPAKEKLINAHPDLAGRLALAKRLTADSNKEQASAGLDQLTEDELERFTTLNHQYRMRFDFPFIMAVKAGPRRNPRRLRAAAGQ